MAKSSKPARKSKTAAKAKASAAVKPAAKPKVSVTKAFRGKDGGAPTAAAAHASGTSMTSAIKRQFLRRMTGR